MRNLLTIMFSLLGFISIAQFCPDLGPNQILPCGVNTAVLTADLTACGVGTNPNQTTNYSVSNIPYVAQTNTGTQIFMGDDTQQGPFNIGFNFCFFGTTYTQFYIGSNGWISFSPGQPTTFSSQLIPTFSALVPKNCIMGPWQDWHPGLGGQIRYQTSGVAPCRKLTVSWIGVPMFSCTGNQGTFHIVIYESSNNIENYIQNKPACLGWQGGTAVEGIHNLTGTIGIAVPGRNSTAWVANNDAWKWTPSGPVVTPVLTWYQVGNPIAIGTGPTITVNPLVPTQYTCRFVYPICNAGWTSCNAGIAGPGPDTVLVVPGPPNLLPPLMNIVNPTCFGDCNGSILANPVNGLAPYTYTWSNGVTNPNPTGLCAGTYNLLFTDANGCNGSGTATITNPPQIFINPIIGPDTVCYQSPLESYQTNPIGPGYNYVWSSTPTITTGQGTDSITVDYSLVGSGLFTNTVGVYAVSPLGCLSDTTYYTSYVLNILPTITPIGPLCSNDPCITLDGLPLGGVFSGTGVLGSQFCPDQAVLSNNINYTYTQSGCTFDTTINVVVNIQPVIINISPENEFFELCEGDSIPQVYIANSNIPGSFTWTVMGDTITTNSLSYSWNQIGTFIIGVIETSIDGCISNPEQTSIIIERCPQSLIYIPNSFTPDGDEHNNIWLPVMTSGFDPFDYNVSVINRWGETIFESNDPNQGWDGTYKNRMSDQGIYVFRIRYGLLENDGAKEIYGHINLIR